MTKIDVFSGFLGAGKTTLIKKLIDEAFKGEKLVLIENEFGEIGIDSGFLKDSGVEISEMNSGCICCTLVGDFAEALKKVLSQFNPDRILIEPSGVGKLSDVIEAISGVVEPGVVEINSAVTVVDVKKYNMYMKNFGEFYNNQVQFAKTIVLSRTQNVSDEKLNDCVAKLSELNPTATIITTPWETLEGSKIKDAMEHSKEIFAELFEEASKEACPVCGHHHHDDDECCHEHHHHHHDDDDECCHEHHHHHHDDDECCHEHHHHDDDECCHEHHHHPHDDDDECCHDHHPPHHHPHGHDADEIFDSIGIESPKKYTKEELENILSALSEDEKYGIIVRAKGIVPGKEDVWYHFDFVPEEYEVRTGTAEYTGRICVIGSKINEHEVRKLFGA